MLLDFLSDKRTEQSQTLSFASVNLQHAFLEPTLDEFVTGEPNVLGGREALERDFILVRLLELLAVVDLVNDALLALDDNVCTLLHLLDLLSGEFAVRLHHLLEILSGLITPEHVLEGSLVKMLLNMVERMLSDITNDQVGVLPDFTTLVGLHITNEELDEGTLSGTVGAEDGNTGGERDLECNVVELLHSLAWVLEANLAHLEERLFLRLDTLEEWWVREGKLVVLGGFEGVVRLGLWDGLDKGLEVATVALDLEAVEVKDVGDGVVEESRIVGDDD
jgi:hypothetical protein